MAQVKPLRLKSQKSKQKPGIATQNAIAQVLVSSSIFHLDGTYDYLVAETDSESAVAGTLVKVDFSGREMQGYIVGRKEFNPATDSLSKLKFIEGVISSIPILTPELMSLLNDVALRYGSSVLELLPSALPDRSATGERDFAAQRINPISTISESTSSKSLPELFSVTEHLLLSNGERLKISLQLGVGFNVYSAVAELVRLRVKRSHILVVVPDQKDVELLSQVIECVSGEVPLQLGTHQSKSQRYINFLLANLETPHIVLGTRSAVFTNLPAHSTIVILDDLDESMYDKRAPGWNVRDVALLRSSEHSLVFVSHFPSLEIARLADMGWLQVISPQRRKRFKVNCDGGRRSFQQTIHDGLRTGSVLVTTSSPGYITGFLCQKCRNAALCTCGGKLIIGGAHDSPSCSLCSKTHLDWKCSWCGESRIRMLGRGVGRLAHELGKAFPGVQVIASSSSRRVDRKPEGKVLVISTLGCEPEGQYAAAVLLDGEINFNRVDLRSDEMALSRWLRAASLVTDEGEIFLSLESTHPVVQAFTSRNFDSYLNRSLTQRREVRLPPFFRMATIQGEVSEISKVFQFLKVDGRFELLGPVPQDGTISKLIVRVDVAQGQNLADFLLDFRRLRSIKGLTPLTVRIDPYAI